MVSICCKPREKDEHDEPTDLSVRAGSSSKYQVRNIWITRSLVWRPGERSCGVLVPRRGAEVRRGAPAGAHGPAAAAFPGPRAAGRLSDSRVKRKKGPPEPQAPLLQAQTNEDVTFMQGSPLGCFVRGQVLVVSENSSPACQHLKQCRAVCQADAD